VVPADRIRVDVALPPRDPLGKPPVSAVFDAFTKSTNFD